MRSTTVRFADTVYQRLERASRATGLPINSIVVVACLDWLGRQHASPPVGLPHQPPGEPGRWAELTARAFLTPQAASDPLHIFTATAQEVLARAAERAAEAGSWIGTSHLLAALEAVEEGRASQVLRKLGLDVAELRATLEPEPAGSSEQPLPTSRLRQVIRRARAESAERQARQVGTEHLLLGIVLEGKSQVAGALEAAGVTLDAVRGALPGLGPED